jgi:hypothetical protein
MTAGRSVTVFPDDLFLVSYPRSGNTWTRFLIGNLVGTESSVSFANIEQRVPDIYQNDDGYLRGLPRPRMLKSHEPYEPRYRQVIHLVRDPRDVAVSYYHYQIKIRRIDDSYPLEDFVLRYIHGKVDRFGSWGEHTGSWIGARQGSKDYLRLLYEEMLEDPLREVGRIADFLRVDCSNEHLKQVIDLSSADRMRQLERVEAQTWQPLDKSRTDKPFVRSASSGRWETELPFHSTRAIENAWQSQMEFLGYLGQPGGEKARP